LAENIKKQIIDYKEVFLLILVMTILLYDLVFNIACFFHECHFFVYLVASVLYSHVVMGAISTACEQAPSGVGAQ